MDRLTERDEYGNADIIALCGEEHEWETYRASYCDTCGAKMSWEEDTI